MKLINFIIYFFLIGIVHSINYGIFELNTIRRGGNLFLFRGANPNAFSLTPASPGVIVTFFRYNGESNIYYSHRIQIVENLNHEASQLGTTPNTLANSGRIIGYAYRDIPRDVFNGLNVANLNQLINGPNLITPVGPFHPIGRMIDVLALLGRWIELRFTSNIQAEEFADDHPQKFSRPSESYDDEGGGSGVSNDLELAFYQKNPNGVYYIEKRKEENKQGETAMFSELIHQGTNVVKEAANGVKITGVNIWNKAKGIFTREKETINSKTSSAVVKVEKEANAVVTSVKNDGNAVVKAGKTAVDTVKKESTIIVKTGESIIETTKKEGNAFIDEGGAVISEIEKDGVQFARGAEEMGEVAGEVAGDLGRATAGRLVMDLAEVA
ncbi:hypothetical protein RB653_000587 [Dictyostelium firmibasis]|uniref:Uncharacterized protein n=1 Tax=Dictyostelium firmibasis TaxID=79012 RepID=A0AAN7YY05_9MYCE